MGSASLNVHTVNEREWARYRELYPDVDTHVRAGYSGGTCKSMNVTTRWRVIPTPAREMIWRIAISDTHQSGFSACSCF
jgi:hypothetical protein